MFRGAEVRAADLSLKGDHGWAYRDVTLHVGPGCVTAITGQAGSGRTSLLLTLAGRMKPTGGTISVSGHTSPKAIRRIAALGLVDGVNDLEKALSVGEHLHERSPGLLRRGRQEARAARALELAGLDLPPDDRTLVRDLGREQRIRLGIALALLDEPGLLVVDNIDIGVTADQQEAIWRTLSDLAGLGLTIVASCVEDAPVPSVHLPSGAAPREAAAHGAAAVPDGDGEDGGDDGHDGHEARREHKGHEGEDR
ncbi:ATP-binding cassette domain-containing protein [Streptosporangium sandarakinum]|uniref:ATP-binding cassette domain-containing protein n=1 Tax=Streptosporangium sandarakinum TaxID=1260955 RepID=UPI0033A6BCB2